MQIGEGSADHHAVVSASYSKTHVVGEEHVIDTGVGNKIHYFASLFPWAGPKIDAGRNSYSDR
jgi:hypothetical protein|tara:strand:+ start:681 stop:869 length:189 start_codon:yes stop_codon:yes gene_type:complete